MAAVIVTGRRVRIASPHAARTDAHAADTHWPGVGQFLHNFRPGDVQLGRIDLPAVTRRHVAESLRVELPRRAVTPNFFTASLMICARSSYTLSMASES